MPVNDYKPLANDAGADVETQAQYLIDLGVGGSLEHGYKTGKALSAQVNKTFRQVSMIAAAVAQTISDVLAIDVLDDGNLAALVVNLKAMLAALSWSAGDVKLTYKTVADAGWLMMDDTTIGSAGSGATHAGAGYLALYTVLWTNISQPTANAFCTVATGLGGSAAADFAANKKLQLAKQVGRALALAGAGVGLTARVLGSQLGNETHVQAANEVGTHAHGVNDPGHLHNVNGNTGGQSNDHTHGIVTGGQQGAGDRPANYQTDFDTIQTGGASADHSHGVNINSNNVGTGISVQNVNGAGAAAMDIMNPVGFLNAMVKL